MHAAWLIQKFTPIGIDLCCRAARALGGAGLHSSVTQDVHNGMPNRSTVQQRITIYIEACDGRRGRLLHSMRKLE